MTKRRTVKDLHAEWMKKPSYAKAYAELEPEFKLASAVIAARVKAGLTQAELADRMNTKQTVIARLESGRTKPSTRTLERVAEATGLRMKISFETVPRFKKGHSIVAAHRNAGGVARATARRR